MGLFNRLIGGTSGKEAARPAMTGFNYAQTNPLFGSTMEQGQSAGNALAGLLNIGGDPAAAEASFKNYLGSTGYQFQLGQGLQSLTANNATKGLLNSGAALKSANQYGQGLAANYFQTYLQSLMGQQQAGLGAAQTITAAGTQGGLGASNALSSARASDLNAQGSVGAAFASDERLKENVKFAGIERGVTVYDFNYTKEAQEQYGLDNKIHRGVLAQELVGTRHEKSVVENENGHLFVRYDDLPVEFR